MGLHRLAGMHGNNPEYAQSEDSTGGLPPIGNLSLGKANMVGSQTQRRGLMPAAGIYGGHADATSSGAGASYGKTAKAGGSTAKRGQMVPGASKYGSMGPSNNTKVAPGLVVGQTPSLASLKLGPQSGQDTMSSNTLKFKANNTGAKAGSKYVSPYSRMFGERMGQ